MAEGWTRFFLRRAKEKEEEKDIVSCTLDKPQQRLCSVGTVASAGIQHGTKVRPGAIKVMAEVGIDISKQTSDGIETFRASDFTHVISMCGCGGSLDKKSGKVEWTKREHFAGLLCA